MIRLRRLGWSWSWSRLLLKPHLIEKLQILVSLFCLSGVEFSFGVIVYLVFIEVSALLVVIKIILLVDWLFVYETVKLLRLY